jgi:hypothetical protein
LSAPNSHPDPMIDPIRGEEQSDRTDVTAKAASRGRAGGRGTCATGRHATGSAVTSRALCSVAPARSRRPGHPLV